MREERSSVHVVAKDWFVPLSCKGKTLSEAYNELNQFGLEQDEVPWVIQMVENPKWDLPGVDIFHGATSLMTHDYIHILLGRGVLPRDEAFVIGFTMGSTNRVTATEEKLYTFFAKYLSYDPCFLSTPVLPDFLLITNGCNRYILSSKIMSASP